jgi:serine/threonine-protein kinase
MQPGTVLLNKFVIERELGRGGMGLVLAAHHVELDERVAIKVVLPDHAKSEDVVKRFVREARAAARIKSEHVARVSDVGRLDSGEPYMVMELLAGEDLEKLLETRGPLPIELAIDYLMQALEGIAEAHAQGVVHRDLKPANLFVTRRRNGSACVKVLDFGISKLEGDPTAGMTKTQGMLGSPLYMSPEQLQSAKDVDAATDIWSLGIILYQLLTGAYPFNAQTIGQLAAAILSMPPQKLRDARPEVPPALEAVFLRCVEKKKGDRFPNVAALAAALAPFGPPSARVAAASIADALPLHSQPTMMDTGDAPSAASAAVAQAVLQASTLSALGGTKDAAPPARPPAGRTIGAVAGVSLLLGAAAVAYFTMNRPVASAGPGVQPDVVALTPTGPLPAVSASPPVTPAPTIAPVAAAGPPAVVAPNATAPAVIASAATAPPAVPAPSKTAIVKRTTKPTAAPVPFPAPAPAPAATADCSQPFYVDKDGIRKVKPECR